MIPKKIHYCWLSDDDMPVKLIQCIKSWKKFLPDYEIQKWDLTRFPLEKNIWVKQAFERKKYAFAADYIRLYALATEGGIYLDSDVEVIKPFDDLLCLPYFLCTENSPQGFEAATIGAEADTQWVLKCLEYYEGKTFVDNNGKERTAVLPSILKECISKNFQVNYIKNLSEFSAEKDLVSIFPLDYFSPKNYVSKKIKVTENTYSIHHFAGTWQPIWKKVLLLLWVPFSVKHPKLTKKIKHLFNFS